MSQTLSPQHDDDSAALWGLEPVRWSLRMFELGGNALVASLGIGKIFQAASFLGVELACPMPLEDLQKNLLSALAQRRESLTHEVSRENPLTSNLRLLERTLGLTAAEQAIVAFRVMLHMHEGFGAIACAYVRLCPDCVLHRRLAALFDVPLESVERALDPRGNLARSGLMSVMTGLLDPFDERVRIYRGLVSRMFMRHRSAADVVESLLPPRCNPHLAFADYPHITEEVRLLHDYLAAAIAERRVGVNVLLHGEPGSGKTELASALAQSLGRELYAVRAGSDDGEQLTPRERLMSLSLTQRLVQVTDAGLVLIDEAEDLFPIPRNDPEKSPTKVAVNECLDNARTPTIWISNRTRHVDEAFLRRFDLVIHVAPLPASAKCELLRRQLPALVLTDSDLRAYVGQPRHSPAVLSRMARVACSVADANPERVHRNLGVLSRHYLQTLGETALLPGKHAPMLEHDLGLLNTDTPLESVLATMQHTCVGARMLLSGPPGTGKTALAKVLADHLDKPLLQRRASSLLSPYLGETEHKLRDMFDEARMENGVLLFDEADSFLRSRDDARARWEVTQTNELLTQMEAFEGIFICTTNRPDDLDPACLRRFDLKVGFHPLRDDQRTRLLRQCCACLGIAVSVEDEQAVAEHAVRLENLTPGDAAAALRHLRLVGDMPTLDQLVAALAEECRWKPDASRPIGFLR